MNPAHTHSNVFDKLTPHPDGVVSVGIKRLVYYSVAVLLSFVGKLWNGSPAERHRQELNMMMKLIGSIQKRCSNALTCRGGG